MIGGQEKVEVVRNGLESTMVLTLVPVELK